MTITVLITRPDPSGLALADQLRNRWGCGVRLVVSPVLEIRWSDDLPDLRQIKTLIFTSKHGVAAFARLTARRDIPCYAVGPATARRAQDEGFSTTSAKGDVDTLFSLITADAPTGPCLHIRGEHTAGNLSSRLTNSGHPTRESVLYQQAALPLNDEALTCLGRESPVILPLYSPRTAQILFEQINPAAPVLVAAISANVAAKVPKDAVNCLHLAQRPDADAMFKVMDALLEHAKLLEGANRAQ